MEYVPIHRLKSGMVLAMNVDIMSAMFVNLLSEGQVLSDSLIRRLEFFDVKGVYVKNGIADDVPPDPPIIDEEMKSETLEKMENVFNMVQNSGEPVSSRDIKMLREAVSHIVDDIINSNRIMVNISDLKSYDDYTYHHSLSVTLLSIAMGVELRFNKERLDKLGLCSLMHDIGKVMVPVDLITKPARLSDEEFAVVKQHAALGGKYLIDHHLCDQEICSGVISHHEKLNGTGYPLGLAGNEIPLFGRIITIADVYDALTSNRPYRIPMQPAEAAEYIMSHTDADFDYDLVKVFLRKVELYPVGSYVQLSDGRICVVLDNENPLRPIVRPLDQPDQILDLYRDHKLFSLIISQAYVPKPKEAKIILEAP